MTATSLGGNLVQITGTVLDENPQNCLVNLGGVTSPIAFVNQDGTFEIVTTLPGGDLVTAFAVDDGGLSSELRATPANARPVIAEFDVAYQSGGISITGRVQDEHPDTCTVVLTSSIPELNNITLRPAEGGYFSFVWVPSAPGKSGSLRAIATDDMCQQSNPVDRWIG